MEGRCRAAICNCASWHGKCPLAVISGTTLDGEKPLSELHVRMSAASVVTQGAGMAGLCVYNVGLQLCKWKVGSSGHGTVKAQSSWRHLRDGLLDNTSESKPRDPNRPHCVMEASQLHFTPHPLAKGRDLSPQGFCQAVACRETSGARHTGQVLGGFHSTQAVPTLPNTTAKWPECWRL